LTGFDLTRRRLTVGLTVAALVPAGAGRAADSGLTSDDKALVDQAAAYLESLGEARGRFEQTDPRGVVTAGDLYLSRPGKARFAYDPPYSLLIVSDGHTVWVTDPRLHTVNHYPLKQTPLALFLADHVRLDQGVVVDHVERFSDGFTLFARDGRHWAQGRVALTFGQSPLSLRQWSLTNSQGQTTQVRILDLKPASGLDPALFLGRGG